MLAIGNYMIKILEFSSEIWETIRLVHYKSISNTNKPETLEELKNRIIEACRETDTKCSTKFL
jgi:hypothetical protein